MCPPPKSCSRSASATRAVLWSAVLTAGLGLTACSTPAPLSPQRAPLSPGNSDAGRTAQFGLASTQQLVIVTDGGVALHVGATGKVSVDRGASGDTVVTHWHGTGPQAELDLACPTAPAPGAAPCPAIADVSVPVDAAVTVRARNAGVTATGLGGPLDLETTNGDVTVVAADSGDAPVQLTTRNGSVHASGLRAPTLAAHTVNGDVDLSWAGTPGSVTADTTNGSVDVALPADATAYAVATQVRNGEAHVDVPTDPASAHRLTLTTVNGGVTARTAA